jgi:very-short-patch-repair endonuclease
MEGRKDPPPAPPCDGGEKRAMSYKTASPDRYALLKEFARENRKNATLAETILWEYLRRNALGIKFLRQHIIGDYIVDFVSRHEGLVIEVDGGYHSEPRQQADDKIREEALEQMGYHVIRFTNEEVLNHIETVIEQIEEYFNGTENK